MEREVNDIISVVLSSSALSLIVFQPDYEFDNHHLIVVGFSIMIISGFLHTILRQIKSIDDQGSLYFAYLLWVGTVISVIGIVIQRPGKYPGMWDDLPGGIDTLLIALTFILTVNHYYSLNADLLVQDEH